MIIDLLKKFLKGYIEASKGSFSKENEYYQLLVEEIPNEIIKILPDPNRYKVVGSVGFGNWTKTPWLAILDKQETVTTQKGVYVVYLISDDMQRIYLTLNQGVTELQNQFGLKKASELLKEKAQTIRKKFPLGDFSQDTNISIGGTSNRGKSYEKSTIYHKEYKVDDFPNEEIFLDDLKKIVSVYQNFISNNTTIKEDISIAKSNLLLFKKQIILYGPPGTGKTYNTKRYAVEVINGN